MPTTKTEQEDKALMAQTPAVNRQSLTESDDSDVRSSTRFSLNEKGKLTIALRGSRID